MKNIVLTFLIAAMTFILLPLAANCQWYASKYGVENPGDLPDDQLKDLILKADKNIQIGKSLVLVGTSLGIAGGIFYMVGINKFNDDKGPFLDGWNEMAIGVLLAGAGIVPLAAGIPMWAIFHGRKSALESFHTGNFARICLLTEIPGFQNQRYYGVILTVPIPLH